MLMFSTKPDKLLQIRVEAVIENLQDVWDVERGLLADDKIRRVVVPDALANPGASLLSLPKCVIDQLGLRLNYRKPAIPAFHVPAINIFQAVRLTILGRECSTDVVEVRDDLPTMVGRLPLNSLDLMLDSKTVVGNPCHDGEHLIYPG
jgi:hypothetical protein